MYDTHDDRRTEETKFLDLLVSDHLPGLRRSLDLLVMLPLLVQAPYAQAFIDSNLVTTLSNFVHTYFERDEYPHRHLPRTMVLLSHLASHQNVFFLGRIVSATYPSRQDSDGRALLDLIAYGVFDCHDSDPNHKASSLYTMLMIIALSSPGNDPDHSSYSTRDVVKFLRDKKAKKPKPLRSIFEKLVCLLEQLTSQQRRHDELSKELLAQSSHLLTLHKIISETQKNPAGAASFLDEGNEQLHSFRRGLSQLQSAMQPVSKDPCFARFIDKFLALPDPGNQLLKIHKLLKYDDFDEKKDEMEPMLRSNNGIITSSTHSILSRLVQALFNLSMTSLGADKGPEILVEGGDQSFMVRIMQGMQSVYRLYPKAFQVKYYGIQVLEHNFGRSSLFVVVAKLWQSLKEQSATVVRHYLDADFLKMLESKDEPHAGVVGSP